MTINNQRRHSLITAGGFTLVEAMLAVVILGIAAAGVLLPFTSGASVRAEGIRRTLGARLASDLIEKVVKTPFADIKGSYNYSEPQGMVKDAAGVVFTDSNYANFSRSVTCNYATVPQQPTPADPTKSNFILVTVQVNYSGKKVATISRLVSK
ncbi:MAG: prepilin-type N-terminal cleavage/methylation domain-containing protein [Planctomycetota bacterium]